ncbi:MAG: hypothetical protein V7749_04460 [Cocleimonas sp.]
MIFMSTTGIESWAVDLKDVGAIYPFQGTEVVLVIVGVAAWIGWHIWCNKWEKEHHKEMIEKYWKK